MSRLIDLELTQQSLYAPLKISLIGCLMLIASFLLALFVWQSYQNLQLTSAEISQSLNQKAPPQPIKIQSAAEILTPSELKQINTVVDSLITPWQPLMLAIEQADMPDIALLSIEPSIKKRQILLTGEAKNLQTILRYIEQLEAQPALHQVYLQKHVIEETDISKPVTFSVLAKWKVSA